MAALYHSLFTEKGLELLRESIQTGTKLGITHMSFGDGNGSLPTPNAAYTEMIKEVHRASLNRLAPSKENANWLEADGVIPSAVGGFNIREVGLWAGNIMVAYANYPPTYKPTGDQGTAQIKTIRIVLQIDNTANFELKIDASVVMATIESINDAKLEIYGNTVSKVGHIEELQLLEKWDGRKVSVNGYYAGSLLGGGEFIYDSNVADKFDGVLNFMGWVRQIKGSKISVHEAGAKGDYDPATGVGTDDSIAVQRALSAAYLFGLRSDGQLGDKSFTVNCDGNRNYYIANHVLQPANVTINGNGCTWYGNNKTNDGIHSATWENGNLVDLVPKPLETAHFFRTHIKNILFREFNNSMNLRGFTFGCSIRDCSSHSCKTHLRSIEHYFLRVLRNKAESCDLGYYFSTFSGMLSFQTVSTSNCIKGFHFAQAAQAVKINNISVEGTTELGVYIEGQGNTGGISIQHCYFEGDITTAVEVYTNTFGSVTLSHNFINIPNGTVAKDSANCKFIIEDNNFLQDFGVLLDSSETDTSRSKTIQNPISWSGSSGAPNSPKGTSYDKNKYKNARADLWTMNEHYQIIAQKRNLSGYTQAIHKHHFGLIPANYYGNQGTPETNIIPFCSYIAVDTSVDTTKTFKIDITTSILNTLYVTGMFNLMIYHDGGKATRIGGRFYGNNIVMDVCKTAGVENNNVAVSVSTVENVLAFSVTGLTGLSTPTSFTCTGFIKLI